MAATSVTSMMPMVMAIAVRAVRDGLRPAL